MKQICMLAALLMCAACDELEEANGRGSTVDPPTSSTMDASLSDAEVLPDAGDAGDAGDAAYGTDAGDGADAASDGAT